MARVTINRLQLDYYILWASIRVAVLIARLGDEVFRGNIENIQLYYIGDHLAQKLIQRAAKKLAEVLAKPQA